MAVDLISVPGAVFALWGIPAKQDMDRLVDAVQVEARECGHRVLYITRIPANQPAPSAEVRKYLGQQVPKLVEAIASVHVVMEGEGFTAAMKRGVLTGLFQLMGSRRTSFSVHSVASEVPPGLESALAGVARQMLELAKARGLLDAAGPVMTLLNAVASHERSGFAQATSKLAASSAQRSPRDR